MASRRTFMKTTGAVLGTSAVTSIAGCSALDGVLGGGGPPGYLNWLAAPDALDVDHYYYSYRDLQAVRNNEDNLGDQYDNIESGFDESYGFLDVDFEDVNWELSGSMVTVLNGSFDADDVGSTLEDNDFEEDGDHNGYTVYTGSGGFRAVGVNGSNIVIGWSYSEDSSPADAVETAIDANSGDEERYLEASDDFSTLADNLGTGTSAFGGTQEPADEEEGGNETGEESPVDAAVAIGNRVNVNGETSDVKTVAVFDDEDDVDIDEIETQAEEEEDLDDLNVSQSGRVVTVTGTQDTEDASMF